MSCIFSWEFNNIIFGILFNNILVYIYSTLGIYKVAYKTKDDLLLIITADEIFSYLKNAFTYETKKSALDQQLKIILAY